jgi:hypothetical protein
MTQPDRLRDQRRLAIGKRVGVRVLRRNSPGRRFSGAFDRGLRQSGTRVVLSFRLQFPLPKGNIQEASNPPFAGGMLE